MLSYITEVPVAQRASSRLKNPRPRSVSTHSAPARQSDVAYLALKRMLLTLEIPPGGLLVEAQLMTQLGVGRTPLREAIQRLVADGLLTVIPRHGTQATPINGNDLRQIMEIRIPLEVQAAQFAAERATPEDLHEFERALSVSQGAQSDYDTLFDYQMHALIAQIARNKYLAEALKRLYALSVRLFSSARLEREHLEQMRREHQAIYKTIQRSDPQAAGLAMRRHLTVRPVFSKGIRGAAMGRRKTRRSIRSSRRSKFKSRFRWNTTIRGTFSRPLRAKFRNGSSPASTRPRAN